MGIVTVLESGEVAISGVTKESVVRMAQVLTTVAAQLLAQAGKEKGEEN